MEQHVETQKEAALMEGGKRQISVISSIKTKILLLVVSTIVVVAALMLWTVIPLVKDNMTQVVKNYMKDLAWISGSNIEREVDMEGSQKMLTAEELGKILQDVKVEGMDSSYAYVVAADGTMLYHPTPEKIGQPVENDAVKQLLNEISKGNRPERDIITYAFKGVNKYASFYISQNMDYILIVTVDEKEAFNIVNYILKRSVEGAVFALILCGIMGIIIAFRITRPIDRVTASIVRLSELDLTDDEQLERLVKKKDETGAMARAAVVLQDKLEKVIGRMKGQSRELYEASDAMNQSAEEIGRSVEQVERAVDEIAEGATSQAQETQTATENIIVMGNMIADTNKEVEVLRTNASQMHQAEEKATDILIELNNINKQTKEAVQTVYEQTSRTNSSVIEIKKATEIISSIAEETNLLSLNASIEAARAGEAGRGFAVVASQIQQLAEQSNSSASQINETITSLITEFEETVKIMESIKVVIAKQDEDVAHTQIAFGDVKEGISKSMDSIQLIASKTAQLDEARIKVVEGVQNLTAIAEENVASTEETSATVTEVGAAMAGVEENAKQLYSIANELDEDVRQFRFNER